MRRSTVPVVVYAINMQSTKVGIREFREKLSSYLESKTPVAITRHGATIGIYVPTKPKSRQADLEALRAAGEKMQDLIAAAGTTEDELMADFKTLRRERRKQKS
jgi:antitoxin (DNA-binding transcriptional repressor) of toxin-antitoxin stability system